MGETCVIPDCKKNVDFLFVRAEKRQLVKRALYCQPHGQNFLRHYFSRSIVGDGESRSGEQGVEFDVEVMMFDYCLEAASLLFLREVGGTRLLNISTGAFELSAIRWELEAMPAPRPRTHHAMRSIMTSLGGRLKCVVVDKFVEPDGIYEAKLHIEQLTDEIAVDVRPTDAMVLAIICDVPIFVSNDVVAGLHA